jgi:hypothetical protein
MRQTRRDGCLGGWALRTSCLRRLQSNVGATDGFMEVIGVLDASYAPLY